MMRMMSFGGTKSAPRKTAEPLGGMRKDRGANRSQFRLFFAFFCTKEDVALLPNSAKKVLRKAGWYIGADVVGVLGVLSLVENCRRGMAPGAWEERN
jgi:hypothetical protein